MNFILLQDRKLSGVNNDLLEFRKAAMLVRLL